MCGSAASGSWENVRKTRVPAAASRRAAAVICASCAPAAIAAHDIGCPRRSTGSQFSSSPCPLRASRSSLAVGNVSYQRW